jgi:hypothetical protein
MRSERLAAATGAIYVALILVGSGLATGNGDPQDGPTILAHLREGRSPIETIGVTMEVLGFAVFLVFLGYLYRALRRAEGAQGWGAAVALGAGLVMTAVKLASANAMLASELHANQLTPDLARTLNDIGGGGFVLSGYLYGVFVLAAAASAFASRALPRWLTLSGLVAGILTVAAGTAGILDPAGYVPVPFLLCLAWMMVTSVIWTLRPPRPVTRTTERATDAVPAELSATA